jgi:hypothetical protein
MAHSARKTMPNKDKSAKPGVFSPNHITNTQAGSKRWAETRRHVLGLDPNDQGGRHTTTSATLKWGTPPQSINRKGIAVYPSNIGKTAFDSTSYTDYDVEFLCKLAMGYSKGRTGRVVVNGPKGPICVQFQRGNGMGSDTCYPVTNGAKGKALGETC